MERFCLVIDESGAKGYADKTEKTPGELGVMAGYLFPEWGLEGLRAKLDTVCAKFFGLGKTHITDLEPALQQEMRTSVFKSFEELQIKWVYEAVYVQGLHENDRFLSEQRRRAKAARKSPIKLSGNHQPDLLHAKLFLGVFGKAIVFGMDNFGNEFAIRVISDPIDESVLRLFESEAAEFLNFGKPKVHPQTGFDPRTGEVIRGAVTMRLEDLENAFDDLSKVLFSILTEESTLTLAADILANSVHHQLSFAQQTNLGLDLNRKGALTGHPLEGLLRYGWPDPESNYVADAVFMHPSVAPRRGE